MPQTEITMQTAVTLRDVVDSDLDAFFDHQQDPDALHMAAFTKEDPSDRAAFDAHWAKIRADDTIIIRTILVDGHLVGHVAKFEREGTPEVTYWIDKPHWGKGIATAALAQLLAEVAVRPIYGAAAKDNAASLRVLEKCGFTLDRHEKGFAHARGREIDEAIMKLQ